MKAKIARIVTPALIACGANFSQAHVLMEAFTPDTSPWQSVTLGFNGTARPGIESFGLYVPIPPNNSTQLNADYRVIFKATGSKGDLPKDTIKSHIVKFNTTEGLIPVKHYVWNQSEAKKHGEDTSLANGFTVSVQFSADLYYQLVGGQHGGDSAEPIPPITPALNYTDPAIRNFVATPGPPGYTPLEALIYKIGGLSTGGDHTAMAGLQGNGDCGGKSNLFAAGCRILGFPARVFTGWAIYEDQNRRPGTIVMHARPEILVNGQWVSVEPTWYRTNMPIPNVLGIHGPKAPHLFALHRGMYLTHGLTYKVRGQTLSDGTDPKEKDPFGNLIGAIGKTTGASGPFVSLQTPALFVNYSDGTSAKVNFNSVPTL